MKKAIISAVCFFFALFLTGQNSVTIQGRIENFKNSEPVYLSNGVNMKPISLSGNGEFTEVLDYSELPSFLSLITISKRGKITRQTPRVWLNQSHVKLAFDWETRELKVEPELPDQTVSETLEKLPKKKRIEYIFDNPNSLPSIYYAEALKEDISLEDLEIFVDAVSPEFTSHVAVLRIKNYVIAKKRAPIKTGKPVENFTLPDSSGNPVSVLSNNSKTKLVALFSSGCAYSVASIDLLEQLAKQAPDNLEIITIWEDASEAIFLNHQKERKAKISWLNLWDEYEFAATYLNRIMWPSFYIIDQNNVLVDSFTGYSKKTAKKIKALIE